MSIEIRVPTLGESIVDATIASWLKKEGDTIQQGDALVELETDKVNVEVNAEQSGVLQKVVKQEGDTVAVGEVLGLIGESAFSSEPAQTSSNGAKTTEAAVTSISSPPQTAPAETAAPQPPPVQAAPAQQSILQEAQRPPSPLARRIAAEHNVDIAQVRGTSPHGRITREDVVNYLEQNAQQPGPSSAPSAPVAPVQATAPVTPQEMGQLLLLHRHPSHNVDAKSVFVSLAVDKRLDKGLSRHNIQRQCSQPLTRLI